MRSVQLPESANLLAVEINLVGVIDVLRHQQCDGLSIRPRKNANAIPGISGVAGVTVSLPSREWIGTQNLGQVRSRMGPNRWSAAPNSSPSSLGSPSANHRRYETSMAHSAAQARGLRPRSLRRSGSAGSPERRNATHCSTATQLQTRRTESRSDVLRMRCEPPTDLRISTRPPVPSRLPLHQDVT